ncbi:hypothetical protein Nepgr_008625 [Nepenthes gracilis]|uniref:NAC domain-containing protein n=1 Tax=Nepenthes gracilis TaxID=150966 RepID=A0AAD3S916_NEPGR|nr:hypothetical protein Nepgr_008625 [Nepenthes gracilis]
MMPVFIPRNTSQPHNTKSSIYIYSTVNEGSGKRASFPAQIPTFLNSVGRSTEGKVHRQETSGSFSSDEIIISGQSFIMAKSWIIDSRGISKKVIGATLSSENQIKDCGAKRECPNCHYWIDNSDVSCEWPGLPAGVKFDPSDLELLDHLASKCGAGNVKPHMFIDEFIPTLEGDKGICYTHPKDLPGAKKDGSSIHFFHKTTNAYTSGQRKRRKIQTKQTEEAVRWHKTGKTRPLIENGIQKGWKKIMVLYRSSKKGSKSVKSNWVMYQYHLGNEKDEKEGEYVVSKIFYQQPKPNDMNHDSLVNEESHIGIISTAPKTPKTNAPNPPRVGSSHVRDDATDDTLLQSTAQDPEFTRKGSHSLPDTHPIEDIVCPAYLAGESQALDLDANIIDDLLLCKEIFTSCAPPDDVLAHSMNGVTSGSYSGSYDIVDLENLKFDTPPDFQLSDLQLGSQDSILSWLDRL